MFDPINVVDDNGLVEVEVIEDVDENNNDVVLVSTAVFVACSSHNFAELAAISLLLFVI